MRRSAFACYLVVLFVLMCSDLVWSIKGGGSNKRPTRPRRPVTPKTTTVGYSPGAVLYGGKHLALNLSEEEDVSVYAKNFTLFPDEVFYPWNSRTNASVLTADIFVGDCFNVTMAKNNVKFAETSDLDPETHGRIMQKIIKYLCSGLYGKVTNAAAAHLGTNVLVPLALWLTSLGQ